MAAWLSGGPALARDALSVRDYLHEKWTAERGAPRGIWALAQGKDGFLWIGSDTGLYRFDGISFERMPGLDSERVNEEAVSALLAARNGDLWIGYQSGRVAIRRHGRLIDVTPQQSRMWIWDIVEDSEGAVYLATGTRGAGIFRYSKGRSNLLDAKLGVPENNSVVGVAAGPSGLIWLIDIRGISSFRGDARMQRDVVRAPPGTEGPTGIAVDSRGFAWISHVDRGTLPLPASGAAVDLASVRGIRPARKSTIRGSITLDRDDNIWGITGNAGIFYIADPGRRGAPGPAVEERLTQADGLSSDSAQVVFADRRGNIWIGTSAGLDRFYKPKIVLAKTIPSGSPYGYLAVNTGHALYALDSDNLYRIDGRDRIAHLRGGLFNGMAVCGLPNGAVWVSASSGNLLLADGKFSPGPGPEDRRSIFDCAVSRDGRLWVNPVNGGLRYYDGSAWQEGPFRGGGQPRQAIPIIAAPEGGILAMLHPEGVFHVDDNGRTRLVSDLSDIPGRTVTAFHRMGDTIWVAAPPYLARYRRGRLQVLRQDHDWMRVVTGMVDGPDGNLWLFGRAGIMRVPLADVERAFADPSFQLQARIYGPSDGLIGTAALGTSHSTAGRAPDGSLWFSGGDALLSVDPRALAATAPAPPVRITGLAYADQALRDPASVTLPSATTRVEIDYTALDLSDAANLRFRYRLEGVDPDWIEAGSQRRAVYTNLGPGKYRFNVIARNSDGVWNTEGAALEFTIRPTFFQSWLFRAMCVALVIALAVTLYVLRTRQITQRLTRSFEDRVAERERIARDLHDTLLQSFYGLMLHFQVAADALPASVRERSAIDAALDRADEVIAEGRDRVYELRISDGASDPVESWTGTAASLAIDGGPAFAAVAEGAPRPLHPVIADEVTLIGDQAIRNAFRHADASRIEARLEYGARGLDLLVRDDGCGIPAELASPAGREGRLGVTSMHERARRISGLLEIVPGPTGGTEVHLFVPAWLAYRDEKGRWRRWFAGVRGRFARLGRAIGPKP